MLGRLLESVKPKRARRRSEVQKGGAVSRTGDIRRQLDGACEAVEALDADLAAGRLAADEHVRQRAEREREVGRLAVALRRAQRARAEREAAGHPKAGERSSARATAPAEAATGWSWLGNPVLRFAAAVLLVGAGVGGGVIVGRKVLGIPSTAAPSAPASSAPTDAPTSAMTPAQVDAMRQAATRDDAPVQGMLEFAHIVLDQGKLDEARRVYERVLARDPRNAEAITHIGAVLYQQGRLDEALAKVDEALRIEPTYIHALWDRIQYLYQGKRDYPGTVKAAEAFLTVMPDGPDADSVRKLLADARQQAAAPKPR
jgi:tetratricopeptide (TPR) repeat protein